MFGEVDACYNTVTQKDLDRFIDFKKVIHPIWAVEVQTRMLTLLAPAVLDGDQTAEGVTGKGKKDNEDEDEVSLGIEVEYAKDILEVFMKMELPAPTAKPTGQDHAGQAGEAAKQAGEENEKTASDVKMEIDVSLGVAKTMAAPAAEAAEQPGAPPLADSVQPPEEKPSAEAAAAAGDSMTAAPSLADSAPAKEQPSAEAAAAAGDPVTTPAAPSLADSAPEAEKPSSQAAVAAPNSLQVQPETHGHGHADSAGAILAKVPTPAKAKSEPIEPIAQNLDAVAAAATLSEPISVIESDQEEVDTQAPTTPGESVHPTVGEETQEKVKEIAETEVETTAVTVTAEQARLAG